LVTTTRSERDSKETNKITIGSLDIDKGLNKRLPLLDHGTELVGGHIHTVKVGETVFTLDFIDLQLDLTERTRLVLGEITKRHLNNTTVERVIGVTETLSTVDKSLTDLADLEHGGSLDIIPILTGEGVNAKMDIIYKYSMIRNDFMFSVKIKVNERTTISTSANVLFKRYIVSRSI
jgi:hypothetical protein